MSWVLATGLQVFMLWQCLLPQWRLLPNLLSWLFFFYVTPTLKWLPSTSTTLNTSYVLMIFNLSLSPWTCLRTSELHTKQTPYKLHPAFPRHQRLPELALSISLDANPHPQTSQPELSFWCFPTRGHLPQPMPTQRPQHHSRLLPFWSIWQSVTCPIRSLSQSSSDIFISLHL